jgi:hypothetical protein
MQVTQTHYFLGVLDLYKGHQCVRRLPVDLSASALIDDPVTSSNPIAWKNMNG